MKLGDVLRKERERKRLTLEDAASKLGVPVEHYAELEGGESPIEEWGPRLAQLAIKLSTPTSRLISKTGQCGELIKTHRERRELSREALAAQLGWPEEELASVEKGASPLEQCAPLLLGFAEMIGQPIFNLFYPCGLPIAELQDYP